LTPPTVTTVFVLVSAPMPPLVKVTCHCFWKLAVYVSVDGDVVAVWDWAPESLHDDQTYWQLAPQLTELLAASACVEPCVQLKAVGVAYGVLSTVTKSEPVGLLVTVTCTRLFQRMFVAAS
jgi:hypothetical protein